MGIPLRLVDAPDDVLGATAEPGDCWPWEANEHNRGWVVKLPDGTAWIGHLDGDGTLFTSGPTWTIAGEPPRLDVAGQIRGDGWAGYIRDGELVDA